MDWIGDLLDALGVSYPRWLVPAVTFSCILLPLPIVAMFLYTARRRFALVPPYRERVAILGASSGTGRALALRYASRGCAQLVLVGRRSEALTRVRDECRSALQTGEEWEMSAEAPGWEERKANVKILAVVADCAQVDDVERVRRTVEKELGGLDTLHIVFGLSALRPLLGVAGVDPIRKMPAAFSSSSTAPVATDSSDSRGGVSSLHADVAGLNAVKRAADAIYSVNASATAVALAAFLPLMQLTSRSPAIVLLSSIAAHVPAPTRALYASSKAAQLLLFQSVALEADSHHLHSIQQHQQQSAAPPTRSSPEPVRARASFCAILPGTILTDFRQGAVDGDPAQSLAFDASWSQGSKGEGATTASAPPSSSSSSSSSDGLSADDVAQKAILAADKRWRGEVRMPAKYSAAVVARMFFPSFIDRLAHKKYQY